jgi:hypothetical protein
VILAVKEAGCTLPSAADPLASEPKQAGTARRESQAVGAL